MLPEMLLLQAIHLASPWKLSLTSYLKWSPSRPRDFVLFIEPIRWN
jgi:hypothetical protein